MTITTTCTVEKYVGDGSQNAWPITFPFFKGEDIKACIVNSAGKQINLTYGSDYTVTKSDSTMGGTLHYTLDDEVKLIIWLSLPLTQNTDFYNTGPLNSEVLETALDRLTLITQQLQEASDRSVKVETSSSLTPEQLLTTMYTGRDAAVASANAAATSENNAAVSEQAAATSESNAADSAQAAAGSVVTAQAWAESETAPDPNDAESKSAKSWALIASDNVPIATATLAGKAKASASWQVDSETGVATVPTATVELAGIVRQSTSDEAVFGEDDTTYMTPLEVKTVIDACRANDDDMEDGTSATKFPSITQLEEKVAGRANVAMTNLSASGQAAITAMCVPDYTSQIVLGPLGPSAVSPSYAFDAFCVASVTIGDEENYWIQCRIESFAVVVGSRFDDQGSYTQTTSFPFFLPKGWTFSGSSGISEARIFPLQGSI